MTSEARTIAEDRLREVAALPLEELLRFEEGPVDDEVTAPSGKAYRIHTEAFWDWEAYDSDLFVKVSVSGRGSRWWQRYGGTHLRGPENEYAPKADEQPEVSSTWIENCACLTFAVVVLGLPLLGALKLVELLRRFGLHSR
jgi:hypothetical protein